ncbi:hypothetical protein F5Y17DRAFT_457249 [Xylariaceae sp. FL0594]|nr:hypothetical protein F5Y17DRAFT_457249 [Xylariaceae sp. FL0594]
MNDNSVAINYFTKTLSVKLKLVEDDTFSDVLGLISDYGSKPSRTENDSTPDPVHWLAIIEFVRTNREEVQPARTPSGVRYRQFPLKGFKVKIGKDDWNLISSSAFDTFNTELLSQRAIELDEKEELATVERTEQRLKALIKKADEVARRARQLSHHLNGRKASIHARNLSLSN